MYPIGILPSWAQKAVSFNPLVQVMQDARRLIFVGNSQVGDIVTTAESRWFPIGVAVGVLAVGIWLYLRESPRFPEVA
jgi:ABC-type polysaccharide/polyol phosphate export permease